MPTPVGTARQCLTPEAAQALDEAVAVARRRAHPQTTSLHAVSALLSLPSSSLRETCSRARNSAYSSRIQFKALELSLGVSLDRLPSSPVRTDEPPVSNSLMAAIKRSQANQRRQPESFHLYQQQQQASSVSTVKVELQNLVLSILDDPVVSRVFGEAGFRSCDIKLAILRPVHQLLRYSRYRGPPTFLCNLTGDYSDSCRRNFGFPFLGFPGLSNGDENSRRIGELLLRNKGRNPLLVGACAIDALHRFCEALERRKGGCFLPSELYGLNVIRIENDVSNLINENSNEGLVKSRFEEVSRRVEEHCSGCGVAVSYGDLKELIGDDASVATASCIAGELRGLLHLHGGKLWLIGAAATYETYLKFLRRFPSAEEDWDLQLLPITSPSPAPALGDSYPRSSLMESFVPFGGFFSASVDFNGGPLVGGSYQCLPRCHLCNEKCEQEVSAITKGGGCTVSVAEHYQSSLPPWLLHMTTELSTNRGLNAIKTKDDGFGLTAKIRGLQRKWDNICRQLHHAEQLTKGNTYTEGVPQVPGFVGFQVADDKKEAADEQTSNENNASSYATGCREVTSCMSMDVQNSGSESSIPLPQISTAADPNSLSKVCKTTSESDDLVVGGVRSPPLSLSNSSIGDGHASPPSAISVTTDLGLGIQSTFMRRELKETRNRANTDHVQNLSGCLPTKVEVVSASNFNYPAQSSLCGCPVFDRKFDRKDFKMLYRALSERIIWQEEAVSAISQAITRCKLRNEKRLGPILRGDIWFTFLGPDSFSKRKIAVALAELLYGSRGNFISADLSSQDGIIRANSMNCHQEQSSYDLKFRGKTVVDYVVGQLSKKPLSVVYLENIDKADLLAQNSLLQAVRTGRFSDSHGREVGISNTVFVTTSRVTKGIVITSSAKETSIYSEDSILRTKKCPIQLIIDCAFRDVIIGNDCIASNSTSKGITNTVIVNKRKSVGTSEIVEEHEALETTKRANKALNLHLDLNLPSEEIEAEETDSMSGNSKVWLEDFSKFVDETVTFNQFDFDKLAEKIAKEIGECFHKIVGSDCLLEIDTKVMDQILAAACLSENSRVVEDWVKEVLSRGFVEARKRYNLTSRHVLKLVLCEGLFWGEQTPGAELPSRIIVN